MTGSSWDHFFTYLGRSLTRASTIVCKYSLKHILLFSLCLVLVNSPSNRKGIARKKLILNNNNFNQSCATKVTKSLWLCSNLKLLLWPVNSSVLHVYGFYLHFQHIVKHWIQTEKEKAGNVVTILCDCIDFMLIPELSMPCVSLTGKSILFCHFIVIQKKAAVA